MPTPLAHRPAEAFDKLEHRAGVRKQGVGSGGHLGRHLPTASHAEDRHDGPSLPRPMRARCPEFWGEPEM